MASYLSVYRGFNPRTVPRSDAIHVTLLLEWAYHNWSNCSMQEKLCMFICYSVKLAIINKASYNSPHNKGEAGLHEAQPWIAPTMWTQQGNQTSDMHLSHPVKLTVF